MIKSGYSASRWWENKLSSIRNNFTTSFKAMSSMVSSAREFGSDQTSGYTYA